MSYRLVVVVAISFVVVVVAASDRGRGRGESGDDDLSYSSANANETDMKIFAFPLLKSLQVVPVYENNFDICCLYWMEFFFKIHTSKGNLKTSKTKRK